MPALFPVVGFYAYFEDGVIFGKMDNLLGPQMERDQRRTQYLRLLNSLAAAGWMWKTGSLSGDDGRAWSVGTRPDLNIEYKEQPPTKIQPVETAGAGFLNASMASERDMEEIASVNRESLAKRGPAQSGVAIDLRKADPGNEIVFSNLSYSSVIFGNLTMQILRCGGYYSYEEIKSLIDKEEDLLTGPVLTRAVEKEGWYRPRPAAAAEPGGDAEAATTQFAEKGQMLAAAVNIEYEKKVAEFQQADQQYKERIRNEGENVIMESVNDIKVGRYGLKVVESPTSPTLRSENFERLAALDKMRPGQLPFDEMVMASGVQNAERVVEKMKTAQPIMPVAGG